MRKIRSKRPRVPARLLGKKPVAPIPATRKCKVCGEEYPLTREHFHRSKGSRHGFKPECKWCETEFVRAHYIGFTREEWAIMGSVGALCLLWTEACGTCEDLATCWRINGSDPEDLPFSLQNPESEDEDADTEK